MSKKMVGPNSSRNWLWEVSKIVLAIGLLGFVVTRTDFSQITSLGSRISPAWLVLNIVLLCILTSLKALQYHYMTDRKSGYFRILGIVVVQNALTNFVASTAGIASFVTMMGAERDIRVARASVSFLVVKLADLIAVFVLMLVFTMQVWSIPIQVWWISQVVFGVTLFILFMFFSVLAFRKRFVNLIVVVVQSMKLYHWQPISRGLDLLSGLSEQSLSQILKKLATAVGFSLIYMLVSLLWGYARLRVFSLIIDFKVVALITCLLQLASWVPVFVFGGLGISESIAVYLFSAFGFAQSEVAAVMLAARLVFYLINALMLLYIPLESFIAGSKALP